VSEKMRRLAFQYAGSITRVEATVVTIEHARPEVETPTIRIRCGCSAVAAES
jgi:hypothetical protein